MYKHLTSITYFMKSFFVLRTISLAFLLSFTLFGSNVLQAQTISTYAGTYGGSASFSGDGGPATAALMGTPGGVAADTVGNIYITDNFFNYIYKVDASGIITIIGGNGGTGFSGDGGSATNAELNYPQGICADNYGNVYFADEGNSVVRKIDPSGIISTVAGLGGSPGYSGDGGPASIAHIAGALDVAISRVGNLYIADGVSAIRMVNPSGVITTFAGGSSYGYSGDGGAATSATLWGPYGLAVDLAGNVYVADEINNVIREINASGIITTVAGNGYGSGGSTGYPGSGGYTGDGGAATNAELNNPDAVAVDISGNLYITDQYNDVIRVVNASSGVISTFAGTASGFGYGGDGGPATDASLNFYLPPGYWDGYTAVDKHGNVFIADFGNNVIREVVTIPAITIATATDTVCEGTSVTYTATVAAGTSGTINYNWFINSTAVGTDASTFMADSVHNNDTITCVLTGATTSDILGTSNMIVMTVNPSPNAGTITGMVSECVGTSTVTLSDAASGGTWSSSNMAKATISSSGQVFAVAVGTTTISYTVTSAFGCGTAYATYAFNVISSPSAGTISGATSICTGSSSPLTVTGASGSGSWSSSATSVATVDASGNVYGAGSGSATITFTVSSSCGADTATYPITVGSSPSAGTITGPASVCPGSLDTLSNTTTGGSWTSATMGIATISATGVVTGVSPGTALISYALTSSCGTGYATYSVTVLAPPSAGSISGATSVCVGASILLTESGSGGSWSSSATGIATTDASGNVYGASAGSVNIIYTVSNTCGTATATYAETVNPLPSAGSISGATSVCPTASTGLSDGVSGGTWSSGTTSIATVDASGNVTGVSAGGVTISYGVGGACGTAYATYAFTVSPLPNAGSISGASIVCTGATISLTDAAGGGSWSSSATSTATVDASGNVTGVSTGTVNIIYTVTNSCGTATASQSITVNLTASGGTISGSTSVCAAASITLSDGTSGGAWSSGTMSVATVDASGNVYGASAGSATISYGVTTACGTAYATYAITVNPLPNAGSISGATSECSGASVTLTDAAGGGSWSSSATSVATVDASGNVYGATAGSTSIIYSVTNGCGTATALLAFSVLTAPSAGTITGGSFVCAGGTFTLSDAASGGSWSSSTMSVATVDAGGLVTGVTGGSTTISYTVTNACGSAFTTESVTVGTSPTVGAISGPSTVCSGSSISLTDAVSGGSWSSSATSVATIDASGNVTGVVAGTTTITYTITTACGSAATLYTIMVNSIPYAGTISGLSSVCPGHTIALTDPATGGSWNSGATSVATVNTSGIVTGVGAGTSIVSYSVSGVCGTSSATITITVNPNPFAGSINGADSICIGVVTTMTDTVSGGTWLSSANYVATVDGSGHVTGVSADTVNIIYSVTNVCGTVSAAHKIKVNSLLDPGIITGATHEHYGNVDSLHGSVSSPFWVASNSNATVSSGGVLIGVTPGIDTIYHNFTNTCGTSSAIFIDTVTGVLINGVANLELNFEGLTIYPNPNRGVFTVNLTTAANEDIKLVITNIIGEKVEEITVSSNKETEVQLNGPAGIYFLSAVINGERVVKKIILE